VNAATTTGHTCGWSVGQGNAAVTMPMIRLRCGGWHHPAGTTGGPWRKLAKHWKYRSVLIVTDRLLSSSNQSGPMMSCLEMATQAVHFTECNGQWSGCVLLQKMLFLEFTWPDNRNSRHPEPFFELQLSCVDRFLPNMCLNYKYLLNSSPWHLEGQIR